MTESEVSSDVTPQAPYTCSKKTAGNVYVVENWVVLQLQPPVGEEGFLASGTGSQLCSGRESSSTGELLMLQSLPLPSRF